MLRKKLDQVTHLNIIFVFWLILVNLWLILKYANGTIISALTVRVVLGFSMNFDLNLNNLEYAMKSAGSTILHKLRNVFP